MRGGWEKRDWGKGGGPIGDGMLATEHGSRSSAARNSIRGIGGNPGEWRRGSKVWVGVAVGVIKFGCLRTDGTHMGSG